ncbi:MAG: metallophosphatase [Hymenobacteraceae bacterium]|nr:metallophosphatase [Hymenobacteraceae bacterium]
MNRRDFLRSAATAAPLLLAPGLVPDAFARGPQDVRLTILHTNDMHSRIDPFPQDGLPTAGLGGMARRAALIKQIRAENAHVLLLDCGDIWQGTPYFNFYGGELEYKLMSAMGYDAATFGNHDFDNGLEGIVKQLPHAGFEFLIANYDFAGTPLAGRFRAARVFERGGVRVGVFGLGLQLAGLVPDSKFGATKYRDPVVVAAEQVAHLREREKVDFVICLSHLGYSYETEKISDLRLAAQVAGIDLILGGHTHTFLEAPQTVEGPGGWRSTINQVGWAGLNLGRFDVTFRRGKLLKTTAMVLPVGPWTG